MNQNFKMKDFLCKKINKFDNNQTEDYVFLDEPENLSSVNSVISATDYAIANGVYVDDEKRTAPYYTSKITEKKNYDPLTPISYNKGNKRVKSVDEFGAPVLYRPALDSFAGIRPSICVDVEKIITANKEFNNIFPIKERNFKNPSEDYHTIEFGFYPKTKSLISENLETYFNKHPQKFEKANKTFIGNWQEENSQAINQVYKFKDKYYLRSQAKPLETDYKFNDGSPIIDGKYYWFEIEPITWAIKNWNNLPFEINNENDKSRSDTDNVLELVTEDAINSGIPFCFLGNSDKTNAKMTEKWEDIDWTKSNIRNYLNGEDKFLGESFDYSVKDRLNSTSKVNVKRENSYKVVVEESEMSVKEQMEFYINHGESFMLHGKSGIGKSRRVQEIDPNCVMLKLRKGMLPEEILGKTAFNEETFTSSWIPPIWYKNLIKICKEEPDKNHVLFIDELSNVPSTEQSLVFHIVYNKTIDGEKKLPDNCVVVAAGNNPEESSVAFNLPEPLFRRFSGHINLDLDIAAWLEWGCEKNKKGRPNIHPLVAAYVASHNWNFYSSYDAENPPEFAIDPRGWEQVSNIIYDNNNTLNIKMITDKIGSEIANDLIAFAREPNISVKNIINKNYNPHLIPIHPLEIHAFILSLTNAPKKDIPAIREFIEGNAILKQYIKLFDDYCKKDDNSEQTLYYFDDDEDCFDDEEKQ